MGEIQQVLTRPARPAISENATAGLHVVRAVSALYVVVHHALTSVEVPSPVSLLFSFGQEAVLVFFLLSGFLIFANERVRSAHPRGYYLRRLRRIYPPVLLAIAVSALLLFLGLIESTFTWESLAATLLSMQDISALKPGVISNPFLNNSPMWSLSYEVFFYAVFPLVMIGWRRSERITRHAVGVVSVIAYVTYLVTPNHFSLVIAYFLVWWFGAMLARAYLNGGITARALIPETVYGVALVAVAAAGALLYERGGIGVFPLLMVRHFAVALVLMLVLATPLRRVLGVVSGKVLLPGKAVASISFGLYVLHFPLLVQTDAFNSWAFLVFVPVLILLAWVADEGFGRMLPKAPKG